jgi:hypothetical protein
LDFYSYYQKESLKKKLFIFYFFLFHHFLKVFTQSEIFLFYSTITYTEIKKAMFDLKKGKSARILNEVIKYTNPVMINSYMKIFNVI